MSTTVVATGGKGSNPKTTLYVGGLHETVNEEILQGAFLPFGDLKDVNIPIDNATGQHRGFGFVEFEEKEDAAAAIDNMHNSEIYGRVLKVSVCLVSSSSYYHQDNKVAAAAAALVHVHVDGQLVAGIACKCCGSTIVHVYRCLCAPAAPAATP